MKKILLVLCLLPIFLIAQDRSRIRPAKTSAGLTDFEVVETDADTTQLFDLYYDGSMQMVVLPTSTNPDITVVFQTSFFHMDTSFANVQTVTTQTTTGWKEPMLLFTPFGRYGRFITTGNAANDTARFKIYVGQCTTQRAGENRL